ncbi:hypothetical protein [Brytella acorum]|uniref:Uncharacterized protein n=1 Tax=Brytella acorum TaxID=2959299 RepID=A0AA35V7Y1_9PROT|nr:hypothetical protein [Brytella acorum]CAI9119518.1 hypothetical protein LMG32879_000333 [Brytella acorum]
MPFKAERSGPSHASNAAGKVRQRSPFMKAPMLRNQFCLSPEALHLVRQCKLGVDPIGDLPTFPNDFPDHIAFEGIRFPNGMIAKGFGFMLESATIDAFPDVEWLPVWSK